MNLPKPINVLIEDFLSEVDCNKNTIANYRTSLSVWVKWMVINNCVNKLDKAQLLMYRNYLTGKMKVASIDTYMASIKLFFLYLSEKNIHPNITSGIKRLKDRNYEHTRGHLSSSQVVELLSSMPTDTLLQKRNYAIVNLMVRTGMRCIEIVTLNYGDFIKSMYGYELMIQRKGHNEKDATICITDSIVLPILDYLNECDVLMNNGPLFTRCGQCKGGRITTQTVSDIVISSLHNINVTDKNMTAHSLRHTAAMCAIQSGASVYEVQQMLGHKNTATTMIYIRALERENREASTAIKKLDETFKIKRKWAQN